MQGGCSGGFLKIALRRSASPGPGDARGRGLRPQPGAPRGAGGAGGGLGWALLDQLHIQPTVLQAVTGIDNKHLADTFVQVW